MTRTSPWLAAGLLVLAGPAASAATLVPHRAVYELSPATNRAQMDDAGGSMAGRMVFEFTGAACEGYTVNFRFVVEANAGDGGTTLTDLRTSSFEAGLGDSYQFLSQTYSNQTLTEEVKGSATRDAEGLDVKLTAPGKKAVSLQGDVLFPTHHLAAVLDAALAGKTVFEQAVYDGSDSGDKLYRTTAVIGPPRKEQPAGAEAIIGEMRRWPVTIAYFAATGSGDQMPDYSISFDLWENGVSTDLTMDYGDFALSGRLTKYEALPATACP